MSVNEIEQLPAYKEICEIENILVELWKRLEINVRKNITPIHTGSLANRWVYQVVIPLAIATQLYEDTGEEVINT